MRLSKRLVPIAAITASLAVIAVAGYLVPAKSEEVPYRTRFENSAGRVVFTHLKHARDYGVDCKTCHHESVPDGTKPIPCGTCHAKAFDKAFTRDHVTFFKDRATCVSCHHTEFKKLTWNHDAHQQYTGKDCQTCHHDPKIEPRPHKCSSCHPGSGAAKRLDLPQAAHARCSSCHEDKLSQDMKNCGFCHGKQDMKAYKGEFTRCASCHTDTDREVLPTRVNAFHKQCMECHQREGKGPYKNTQCQSCHRK